MREREKENERETTCSNVLENKMNYALLQSFNRTLSNRSGLVAVTVKNTKTGTRVIVSSIFGVQYYFRYAERSNARIGADWTRFTPMIPDQLSIPRTQQPGYEYRPFFFQL